jgi:predicted transcriptional regulator
VVTDGNIQGLPPWDLLTSHGLVLLRLSTHPDATMQFVADSVGLTGRRVASIIKDLSRDGFIEVKRDGRQNRYRISERACFRHPIVAGLPFKSFLSAVSRNQRSRAIARAVEPRDSASYAPVNYS